MRRLLTLNSPAEPSYENVAYFNKATAQPFVASIGGLLPDYPRTFTITRGNVGASVDVTLVGKVHGVAGVTEKITCVPGGTVETRNAWDGDVSITWTTPAGWTSGSISVDFGVAFGLPVEPEFSSLVVYKESSLVGAGDEVLNQAIGTVDAEYATYIPTTPIHTGGGSRSVVVNIWYGYIVRGSATS